MRFISTKSKVHTRGSPPDDFLRQMVEWGRTAPDSIFAVNSEPNDVFDSVKPSLGPYTSIEHRRAAMLEIMRVLAGFESSWNWDEGVDTTNPTSDKPDTMEAGAWQVSANSRAFGEDLRKLAPEDGDEFQRVMKANHALAMEYAARLFRHTTHHNGPLKRHEVDPWLSRDAVKELEQLITAPAQQRPTEILKPI